MAWNGVPVAILAGVCGYAAILFFGLYLSLANLAEERSRREYLTFALTCLAMLAYDVTCVGLYDSNSVEQGVFWMRGNLLTAATMGVCHQLFTWDFLKRTTPRGLKYAVLVPLLGPIVNLWDSKYTLTASLPAIKHVYVFGRHVSYFECEIGVLNQLLMLVFLGVYVANVIYLVRYFRSAAGRKQHGQLGFLIATTVSLMGFTNDVLVTIGIYSFIYTIEYSIATILMAMGYVLLMRFGDLHEAVNALNRDLSRTNADLVVALEQARESSRAKTEFLASISHELRTPLNAIVNLPEAVLAEFSSARIATCNHCKAEFLLDDSDTLDPDTRCVECGNAGLSERQRLHFAGDAERSQGCLQTVARAARHLLGLVNDILDASKLELGRMFLARSSVDLVELVSEVVDSAQTVANKSNVKLRVLVPANGFHVGPVIADRLRIGQVLYNLIGNAIKFSPNGGVVDVSVSESSKAERIIGVRDHGIGIAPEHHQLIFEKFRQVDGGATRTYGGTGLGLAISKELIELHGGRIDVESEIGQGATFFVRIPDVPPAVASNDATFHSSSHGSPAKAPSGAATVFASPVAPPSSVGP